MTVFRSRHASLTLSETKTYSSSRKKPLRLFQILTKEKSSSKMSSLSCRPSLQASSKIEKMLSSKKMPTKKRLQIWQPVKKKSRLRAPRP